MCAFIVCAILIFVSAIYRLQEEVQKWAIWNKEIEATRAAIDSPIYRQPEQTDQTVENLGCFTDTPSGPDYNISTRLLRVVGMMCGRLRHAWILQAALGMGKLLLGGSVDVNIDLVCQKVLKLDEAALISLLKNIEASLKEAVADVPTSTAVDETENEKNNAAAQAEGGASAAEPSDAEQIEQLQKLLQDALPASVSHFFGNAEVENLISSLINSYQNSVYNRQLVYTVLDAVIMAMFPEFNDVKSS